MNAPSETTNATWFQAASLSSKFAYAIACAIQDRREAGMYWRTMRDKADNPTDAERYNKMYNDTMTVIGEMQDMQKHWSEYKFSYRYED